MRAPRRAAYEYAALWDPSRQGRWARRGFRTADTERTRAPSIGSARALRPEWAVVALVVHLRGFAPHPLACHAPASLVKGWRPLQAIPSAAPRGLPLGSRCGRERCVSPTSATNVRHEHPTDCPIPERPTGPTPLRAWPRLRRSTVRQRLPADPRVELRLTANLQLRLHPSRRVRPRGFGPEHRRYRDTTRSWRSLDRGLLRAASPGSGILRRVPSLWHGL
jgi:hypothetical protein